MQSRSPALSSGSTAAVRRRRAAQFRYSTAGALDQILAGLDWTIKPHLLSVTGMADVNVFGGDVRQWQVQVDPDKLMQHGFALHDVMNAARNATGVRGVGYVENANQRIVLTTAGQPADAAQLGMVMLVRKDGRT